jgi:hypothetical protein
MLPELQLQQILGIGKGKIMFSGPIITTIRDIIVTLGLPTIAGGLVWLGKTWQAFDSRTKNTEKLASETKAMVDTVATNHLAHMSEELKGQTSILQNMDRNIGILVDRTPRI